MSLVLAFSVQGTADGLTFRESRSGDLQTKSVGHEFTVSFSVSLGSNTTPIKNTAGKLVDDSNTDPDQAARINSSGYKVKDIGTTEYRLSAAAQALTASGTPNPTFVYKKDSAYTETTNTTSFFIGNSNKTVYEEVSADNKAYQVYLRTGDLTADPVVPYKYASVTAEPDAKVEDADRYHYNEEAIQISVPTGTTLIKVGSYRVNVAGGSSHTMNEKKNSVEAAKLTSSIRLTFRADAVGEKIITITDTTDPSDHPATLIKVPLSFTIFVVPTYDGATTLALTSDGADGYETRNDEADPQVNNLFSNGSNVPLEYSVTGSGRLYVKRIYGSSDGTANGSPMSKSSPTQKLSTSSAALVYLDMNGSSNKVSAYVRDQNAAEKSKTIHFIFRYAQIEIIGGNNKTGIPNARLIDPLHIRVKDAKGRALSGLAVSFTPTTAQGSTLQPVIGTDVYLTNPSPPTLDNSWAPAFSNNIKPFTATATVPAAIAADTAALVPTDSSGEAQVYLKLGGAGNKTVAVSAGGDTDTFYVTSAASTDIPSFEIFSGNNQKSASDGKVADPLVVRVLASSSSPLPNETVTFTTTKGYFHHNEGVFNDNFGI